MKIITPTNNRKYPLAQKTVLFQILMMLSGYFRRPFHENN